MKRLASLAVLASLLACGAKTAPRTPDGGGVIATDGGEPVPDGAVPNVDGVWVGALSPDGSAMLPNVLVLRAGTKGRLLVLPMGGGNRLVDRATLAGTDVELDVSYGDTLVHHVAHLVLRLEGDVLRGTTSVDGGPASTVTWERAPATVEERRASVYTGTPAMPTSVAHVSVVVDGDRLVAGHFVGVDSCDLAVCGAALTAYSDAGGSLTFDTYSGGAVMATGHAALSREPGHPGWLEGTFTVDSSGSTRTFMVSGQVGTRTTGTDALAVLGLLDELAQAWDVPASRTEPPLSSIYIHDGIGRAAMIVRLAPPATPVMHADVRRAHDLETLPGVRIPPIGTRPQLDFEVLDQGTGGTRNYVTGMDDPLRYIGMESGAWVFVGNGH